MQWNQRIAGLDGFTVRRRFRGRRTPNHRLSNHQPQTRPHPNLFLTFNWRDGFQYTAPVASFRANAWGLHDMIGNALQWCSDWYGDYPTGKVENPTGPAQGGQRILRGGAYIYGPRHCRSAFRGRNFANFHIGFRVARDLTPD